VRLQSKTATGTMLLCASMFIRPATAAPSFKDNVQPILDANCVSCHQAGSAPQGLVLESGKSYAAIVERPSTESRLMLVVRGAPDSSYVLAKVTGSQVASGGRGERMPLGSTLPAEDIETIRAWITAGAKND
jgi:mono/diheme cytochrome c family protein